MDCAVERSEVNACDALPFIEIWRTLSENEFDPMIVEVRFGPNYSIGGCSGKPSLRRLVIPVFGVLEKSVRVLADQDLIVARENSPCGQTDFRHGVAFRS
ncbi:hypothetical protein AWH62_08345 [Maricaulis sp. W15]|nr:hypothetical protein AWH62_08345 [Maricaulis sp. W15]